LAFFLALQQSVGPYSDLFLALFGFLFKFSFGSPSVVIYCCIRPLDLAATPEQDQRLLWHSTNPFAFVLLHLQFCVDRISRFSFSLTLQC